MRQPVIRHGERPATSRRQRREIGAVLRRVQQLLRMFDAKPGGETLVPKLHAVLVQPLEKTPRAVPRRQDDRRRRDEGRVRVRVRNRNRVRVRAAGISSVRPRAHPDGARDAAVSLVHRGLEHDPLRRLTEPQIHAPRREVSPRVSEDAHQAIRAEVGFAGDENLARRAERDERSEDRTHVVRVASDAGGEFTVGPRTRAPLAVTQVAVRIEHATREERADVPPAGFYRLPALQHRRRDALLRERERGEETRRAETDDHHALGGGVEGGGGVDDVVVRVLGEAIVERFVIDVFVDPIGFRSFGDGVVVSSVVPVRADANALFGSHSDLEGFDGTRGDGGGVDGDVVDVQNVAEHRRDGSRVAGLAHDADAVPWTVAQERAAVFASAPDGEAEDGARGVAEGGRDLEGVLARVVLEAELDVEQTPRLRAVGGDVDVAGGLTSAAAATATASALVRGAVSATAAAASGRLAAAALSAAAGFPVPPLVAAAAMGLLLGVRVREAGPVGRGDRRPGAVYANATRRRRRRDGMREASIREGANARAERPRRRERRARRRERRPHRRREHRARYERRSGGAREAGAPPRRRGSLLSDDDQKAPRGISQGAR